MSLDISFMPGSPATASALDAYKQWTESIAQNLANAHTTKGPDGKAYRRQAPIFAAALEKATLGGSQGTRASGVRVIGIHEDPTPGQKIYNPSHPHADKNGMIESSNVVVAREMVDLVAASRAYEANLNAIKTSRGMQQKALTIGK